MYKRFLELIKLLSDDLELKESDMDELLLQINAKGIDLHRLNEELGMLEGSAQIEPEEVDFLKSVLVYLFMKNTDIDIEDIYAIVYGKGKRITWQ
ncbi:MAG: hypothetical protein D6710_02400 [Nitrospirae bacterium]|nr:MAG: hypothetical protein D6710_02400 [Nitrospirota bacterium]